MNSLLAIVKKKEKIIIGLMSGTSIDGIDAAVLKVRGSGMSTRFRLLRFGTFPFPRTFKPFLLKNSNAATARLDDVTRLNILIGELFADAAKRIVRKAGMRLQEVDVIGSHGQTIHHLPQRIRMFDKDIRATLQIGDPSVIAKHTGVVTVGDFRTGDIAVGGTGAPLVPYVDYLLLKSSTKNRGVLNIGGIANLTVLPKHCMLSDVIAFDTGPGNMVVDAFMQKHFNKPFDIGGEVANRGRIIPSLLYRMIHHPFMSENPPKSTGREMFGNSFIDMIEGKAKKHSMTDVVTTVTEFTALSIYHHYLAFIRSKTTLDELIVSGGGAKNKYIMNALQRYFENVNVIVTDDRKCPSDAKEAIAFALLANETIACVPSNVPGATGARRATVLGKICLP